MASKVELTLLKEMKFPLGIVNGRVTNVLEYGSTHHVIVISNSEKCSKPVCCRS